MKHKKYAWANIIGLLLILGLTLPAYADGTIFDLVRQTAAGNVPTPGNWSQYVDPNAHGVYAGQQAQSWLYGMYGRNDLSGWGYTNASGWQFGQTPEQPANVWAARSMASTGLTQVYTWSRAALWGAFCYVPAWNAYSYPYYMNTYTGPVRQ